MFRCKDCGQEFDIKPEYCDCGNNVFEEIVVNSAVNNSEIKIQQKEEFKEEYKRIPLQEQISPLAIVIFSICILLSLLSIIFIGRGSNTETQTEQAKATQEKPSENIPSINSLWDNTPAVVKVVEVQPSPVQAKPVEVQKSAQTVKPVQKPATTVKQQTQTQTQKPKTIVQPTKKAEAKPALTQKQTPATQTTSQTDVSKYIPKQTTQVASSQTQQTTVQPVKEEPKVDIAALQKELLNYKIALRNKIASDIDFVKVVGDGNCQITFKIDSSGNLVNRNFAVQSPNNTLNDVVYNAMMRNPSFKTPPQGYKNETLTLTVKMYSGNFEVDLR